MLFRVSLTLAASCTEVKFGNPPVLPPLTRDGDARPTWSAPCEAPVIDGMKKYPAAVRTTNWSGMASVDRRFPAG